MLHAPPRHHGLLPACELGILGRILATGQILHGEGDSDVSHDEGEVGVGTFKPDEPILFVEMELENGRDAPDFTVKAFVFYPGDAKGVLILGGWV